MNHVVVIGAGLAGLSAACRLSGQGYRVTVVERDDRPGGRNGLLQRDGFSFDTGPSVLTMRDLVADAIGSAGQSIDDLLPMRRLETAYRGCFADGSTIFVRHGVEAMRAEIAETCGTDDADAFVDFVGWLRRLYAIEMPNFIDRNFDSPLGLASRPSAAAALLRLRAFGRLGPEVRRRFRDPRLQRLFSFQALYAGLPPETALSLYAVITYMDSIEGVWYPEGGMHAIPEALATAAEKAGTEFRYESEVSEILRSPTGRAAGVRLADGERLAADAVVCTLDLPTAYRALLADLTPPRAVRKARYSPSAVVWHVGVRGVPQPPTAHHNIHFGEDWNDAFTALIDQGRLMPDPSRLVTIPTLDDPAQAPEGCSTYFVLEPVPNLDGVVDWTTEAAPMRDRLHRFLETSGYPAEVVTEELVTPLDWQAQGMAAGTPFALAHTFAQTGPFRPPNVEKRLPGLVFAGSGTVPGVGVPMVLISGKLAAERVRDYLPVGR
ncbi:phytoene desaturase [Friedmanniella endophytica]|uniref:Phytoene desaturase n=1 Tax=Microlunatus kandeliicorticis TaxID=1759536 RepID=A0A7W3ITB1_9ACTN|nr:phytoene desaturase family protein [Microlunatus kandeliicorticis]MBA8794874.1 phytoene desaturase [Microlunatus kandeliicorticis]